MKNRRKLRVADQLGDQSAVLKDLRRIEDHDRICTVAGDALDRRPIVCFAGTNFQ